jgi:hypothetical protein
VNTKKYDEAVQHFIAEPIVIELDTDEEQQIGIYLQEAKTEFYDNAFRYWQKVADTFY